MPKWLKQIVYSVASAAIVYAAVKHPLLFTPDVQASILAGLAAYLGIRTEVKD